MGEFRKEKIAELIHREVGEVIGEEIDLSDELVTVSRVEISPNHQHATVMITVFPYEKSEEVLTKINREIGALQRIINRRLKMRPVPKISFELDQSEQKGQEIIDILDKIE